MTVILEVKDVWGELPVVCIVVGAGVMGRDAATGHGSRALGVGPVAGKGYGITVALPCKRTGLKVLPEGDHMNTTFAP
jgi:hypothetical protein